MLRIVGVRRARVGARSIAVIGSGVGVDSAFLVFNDRTYPTLCRLFADLGVATRETDMSMSVRADDAGLEYAGAPGSWSPSAGTTTSIAAAC
jgi:predicted NAD/FAD-binding protein